MPEKKKSGSKSKKDAKTKDVKKLPAKASKKVTIKYKKAPAKVTGGTIGPRPPLPKLKKGKKTTDITPSPPIQIDK